MTAEDWAGNPAIVAAPYDVVYATQGVLQPVNADGSSVFKSGSTVPVKLRFTDAAGAPVTGIEARVSLAAGSSSILGTDEEPMYSAADAGGLMRDQGDGLYHYNAKTTGLSPGAYLLRIASDDGALLDTVVSVK